MSRYLKKHVCVVGAGAAGLVATRHLLSKPELFDTTVFEQTGSIGGTWVYTDSVGIDGHGLPVHSSMYKNLRTNLPKEIMAFPDYPFMEDSSSFIFHEKVYEYLLSYAKYFDILKNIKFYKQVTCISPQDAFGNSWKILFQDVITKKVDSVICDAVMVCNGHYSVPDIPFIPGISKFQGMILHSHYYREPSPFVNKTVVFLGAGNSGLDIGIEVSEVASKIYISHNGTRPIISELPNNIQEKTLIKEATETGFYFEDGTFCEADAIMFCIGYKYNFSFLSSDCHLNINNRRITPLYQQLIHIEYPTLCLIGILHIILPFPVFDQQCRFFIASLDGTMNLPSKEEMLKHANNDFAKRIKDSLPHHHAHVMSERMWPYLHELSKLGKFESIPEYFRLIYEHVGALRKANLQTYKETNYEITGPITFNVF